MAKAKVKDLAEAIKSLKPKQQRRLRDLLDGLLSSAPPDLTEEEFELELARQGVITLPKKDNDPEAYRRWQPIEIPGKPVSETIIEDRG